MKCIEVAIVTKKFPLSKFVCWNIILIIASGSIINKENFLKNVWLNNKALKHNVSKAIIEEFNVIF